MSVQELENHLSKFSHCQCKDCIENKSLFVEWYALRNNQMIESILVSVRTILSVKDFRHTGMTVGDLKHYNAVKVMHYDVAYVESFM